MTSDAVLASLEAATHELDAAQSALDALLRNMEVASSTETTPVTEVVEQAFSRIQTARDRLRELRDVLTATPR